jgi:hypothetical protein
LSCVYLFDPPDYLLVIDQQYRIGREKKTPVLKINLCKNFHHSWLESALPSEIEEQKNGYQNWNRV